MEENEEILVQTELLLDSNFIEYAGINLYTSREKFNVQPAEYVDHTRKIPLTKFLEQYNQPNLQKEEALLSQVRNVFDAYIQADKARIKRIDRQIKTFNAMESSFAQIAGQKDEIIAYYKARKSKKLNADNAPQEDDDAIDALIDNMAEIKMDLHKTLQKDKADVREAEALCKKFCACIMRIFGKPNGAESENETDSSSDTAEPAPTERRTGGSKQI